LEFTLVITSCDKDSNEDRTSLRIILVRSLYTFEWDKLGFGYARERVFCVEGSPMEQLVHVCGFEVNFDMSHLSEEIEPQV